SENAHRLGVERRRARLMKYRMFAFENDDAKIEQAEKIRQRRADRAVADDGDVEILRHRALNHATRSATTAPVAETPSTGSAQKNPRSGMAPRRDRSCSWEYRAR